MALEQGEERYWSPSVSCSAWNTSECTRQLTIRVFSSLEIYICFDKWQRWSLGSYRFKMNAKLHCRNYFETFKNSVLLHPNSASYCLYLLFDN